MPDVVEAVSNSMNNDLIQLQSVSQNLANINTQGYKREVLSLKSFDKIMGDEQLQANEQNAAVNIMPEARQSIDYHQATLKYTGNNFDIGLEGRGFFCIDSNGQQLYSRKGQFRIDKNGQLSLLSGEPVIGQGGKILLNPTPFSINQKGEIVQDGNTIDALKIVEFENHNDLENVGHGLFRIRAGGANSANRSESTNVMQGYLEASNVNQMDEMIKLINVTRHFEASSKVLQGYDSMLNSAINVLGDF